MRAGFRLLLAATAAVPLAAFAGNMVTPGKWASTGTITAIDMPGMPPQALEMMKKRPISHSYCLTAEQAAKDPRQMFKGDNGECEYTKFEMARGKLNAAMQCKGPQGNMRMTMLGTYTADSYQSTNVMVVDGPRGNMKMTSKTSGKRTGAC
ncbi:DUF3617 domain-containing protein [Sphingosinicella soli]|uniref:DUF3617 domain-containing protein n=1 Tax=Sphingosinicella soli TaxID=333708 RepID=A0A7W7F892_9SPHN|nr:DUF3617 domain-containing protein [Sphingosinicella soli]MBB4633484.1 hypothetical protein [Sphingosinicella soli]